MSGDDGSLTGGRRRRSPALSSPLDNDDLLSDILLRLPPSPSSLPRASLVCKRWRGLVSDRVFLRRFRARHRRGAPLLGFFTQVPRDVSFTPTLEPPDRLPRGRFSLELGGGRCRILGCRHGLVLILSRADPRLLVWDPVTGDRTRVAVPPEFGDGGSAVVQHGAVLRAAGDVLGGEDHPIPFLVTLVGCDEEFTRAFACVYSSETGVWGDLISTACLSMIPMHIPSTLVGSSLYWLLGRNPSGILEFDLDRQCLAVIGVPLNIGSYNHLRHWVVPAEGGGLSFLCLSGYSAQLWTRKTDCDGVTGWVLGRTIELDKILPLNMNPEEEFPPLIFGFTEEGNVSFLATNVGVFMVQLESAQFKKPFQLSILDVYHPFASVYTAGNSILNNADVTA
ncbi:hypothetical protein BAE44_0023109 [Dichanthelium oligosanthes]|uniref:F-box domain-containing protein n=1 Tax=Dichanthelium oligosanthes TaxID=888268 RepID=A0A1E5USS5_9POAL|nr:hypothetical protein BAE44_0023109 [Dichanthelium oligosanthes]